MITTGPTTTTMTATYYAPTGFLTALDVVSASNSMNAEWTYGAPKPTS